MQLTELERQRVEKLERLRAGGIDPYPRRVKRTHTVAEALAALITAEAADEDGPDVAVAGRLRSIRVMGKVAFAHIEDESGSIQLFLRIQNVGVGKLREEPSQFSFRSYGRHREGVKSWCLRELGYDTTPKGPMSGIKIA